MVEDALIPNQNRLAICNHFVWTVGSLCLGIACFVLIQPVMQAQVLTVTLPLYLMVVAHMMQPDLQNAFQTWKPIIGKMASCRVRCFESITLVKQN